ncbi:MAG: 50S ribosomal protein L9 [Bacilli bacterium]|nr:50S ribosomal protein L9 [Bacilli bacterium]
MRVILLEDVKKQGKKGDIINVKDGFGNFLINNKKAVMETKGSKKVLDIQNAEAEALALKELEESKLIKKSIEKLTLHFKVKVGKGDQVFGSISTKQISMELKKHNIDIDKRKINVNGSINTLGTTNVEIDLHKDVKAILKVHLEK